MQECVFISRVTIEKLLAVATRENKFSMLSREINYVPVGRYQDENVKSASQRIINLYVSGLAYTTSYNMEHGVWWWQSLQLLVRSSSLSILSIKVALGVGVQCDLYARWLLSSCHRVATS